MKEKVKKFLKKYKNNKVLFYCSIGALSMAAIGGIAIIKYNLLNPKRKKLLKEN